jgi:hypothetical protein
MIDSGCRARPADVTGGKNAGFGAQESGSVRPVDRLRLVECGQG